MTDKKLEKEKADMIKIHDDMVLKVLEYLKTGDLTISGSAYTTAYQ